MYDTKIHCRVVTLLGACTKFRGNLKGSSFFCVWPGFTHKLFEFQMSQLETVHFRQQSGIGSAFAPLSPVEGVSSDSFGWGD